MLSNKIRRLSSMKRAIILIMLAVFALSAASAAQTSTPVLLEYKFKKGEIDKYKAVMDKKMSMSGASGGFDTKMTMSITQKVLEVLPDGSAKIQMITSDIKTTDPSAPKAQPKALGQKPVVVTLTMGKNGEVQAMEGKTQGYLSGAMQGMDLGQLFGQTGSQLPENPVSVGESWKQEVPFPLGGGTIGVTSTLLSDSDLVAKLRTSKIKQVFVGHIDLSELVKTMASQKGVQPEQQRLMSQMSGAMELSGWAVVNFAPEIGKPIRTNANFTVDMKMTLPPEVTKQGGPSEMNIVMTIAMNMWRLQ
jgi:hypothetical protein